MTKIYIKEYPSFDKPEGKDMELDDDRDINEVLAENF